MTGPTRLPHGYHARDPRVIIISTTDEHVVLDDEPEPAPRPNRAARRAAARARRNKGTR
ncbi:hypothetical protein [Streptomyces cyaneofuscatus]|uniref:hypothetical protein n=1 Tax=Streptomyces cyaneofuscatus TaxID=66883 RepID=UPI001EF248E9|nr:hypothetical protein [Streptomyces cyaneofuscatus]